MKIKKILIAMLAVAMLGVGAIGLTSCGGDEHTHEWIKGNTKEATCSEKGEVLYHCACGESYAEEIEINSENHHYVDYVCVGCETERVGSVGLKYAIINNTPYYEVTGIGECTDTDIVIPAKYKGLPVTSIAAEAFAECNNITSITFGKNVENMGVVPFSFCDSLTRIEVDESKCGLLDFLETLDNLHIKKEKMSFLRRLQETCQ